MSLLALPRASAEESNAGTALNREDYAVFAAIAEYELSQSSDDLRPMLRAKTTTYSSSQSREYELEARLVARNSAPAVIDATRAVRTPIVAVLTAAEEKALELNRNILTASKAEITRVRAAFSTFRKSHPSALLLEITAPAYDSKWRALAYATISVTGGYARSGYYLLQRNPSNGVWSVERYSCVVIT